MWKNKRNKRRGEIMGQVFIYITAAIVFAVVLIFGYQAITGFLEKGEKIAFVTFKTDLENAVKNIYADAGSAVIYNQKNPLAVPGRYKEVCFVNLDYPKEPAWRVNDGLCVAGNDYRPLACNVWVNAETWEKGDQNVFLEPMGLSPIKVYRIALDTNGNNVEDQGDKGYLCLNVTQGRLDMKITGMGNKALISRAE